MAVSDKVKVHWTHKMRVIKLYKEGYSREELAIMYNLSLHKITMITRYVEKPERT